jgi:integrase
MMLADATRPASGRHAPTVAQLERGGRKPSHIEGVRLHLRAHVVPLLGDEPADLLGTDDVQRLVDRLLRLGRTPKTISNVLGRLHSALDIAVEQGTIATNPCRMANLPKDQRERPIRFLTLGELERVLAAAPPADAEQTERDFWPTVRMLILTAARTGMRLGELRALRWEDPDMAALKVRVRRSFVRGHYGAPKSLRSVRAIPLAPRLVAELAPRDTLEPGKRPGARRTLHRSADQPGTGSAVLQAGARARWGTAGSHPRPAAYLRDDDGREPSLRTIQEWMGHRGLRTTQLYADYMPSEREAELIGERSATSADSNWTPILVPRGLSVRSNPPEISRDYTRRHGSIGFDSRCLHL